MFKVILNDMLKSCSLIISNHGKQLSLLGWWEKKKEIILCLHYKIDTGS